MCRYYISVNYELTGAVVDLLTATVTAMLTGHLI